MKELTTIKDTVDFANDLVENPKPGMITMIAAKPSGKFVIAEPIDETRSGITYNSEGGKEIDKWMWDVEKDGRGWLVTVCDKDGNPITAPDEDGVQRPNSYPMSEASFEKRYGAENIGPNGVVEAKSIPQTLIRLDEFTGVGDDGIVITQPWGGDNGTQMTMAQGSWINVTELAAGNVYGIDESFVDNNYTIISEVDLTMPNDRDCGGGVIHLLSDGVPSMSEVKDLVDKANAVMVRGSLLDAFDSISFDSASFESADFQKSDLSKSMIVNSDFGGSDFDSEFGA